MNITTTATLNNGTTMPMLGLGTWQSAEGEEAERAVAWALEAGYRHIDTAAIYKNERSVGKAVRQSGIPRDELFITTKLWNTDIRSGDVRGAFDASLEKLGLEYVDLYLVHWAVPDQYLAAWEKMEGLYRSGRTKAIGVSNFMIEHLDAVLEHGEVVPAVNQCEWHPKLQSPKLVEHCRVNGIQFESWSPLMRGKHLDDPTLVRIAKRYGKTPAQVIIRWNLQSNVVVIPKSASRERIVENADVFDFELDDEDMTAIRAMDADERMGFDPYHVDF